MSFAYSFESVFLDSDLLKFLDFFLFDNFENFLYLQIQKHGFS
jgi:hypothetical protein